jgi:hypothetical protein
MWITSSTMGLATYLIVTAKIFMITRYMSILNFAGFMIFSLGLYQLYLWVSNYSLWIDINHTVIVFHETPLVWAVAILVFVLCHAIDRFVHYYGFLVRPTPADFLQKMASTGERHFTKETKAKFDDILKEEMDRVQALENARLVKVEEKRA